MNDTNDTNDRAATRERLSALIDGELAESQVAAACQQWRGDADARASWHAYQLIGDALRSDDLCSAPGHDAAFLASLRGRLADEPVVLAPQAPVQAGKVARETSVGARRGWRTPVAVAAGFVAVVGVVVAMQFPATAPGPAGDASRLAGAPSATVATSAGPALPSPAFAGRAPAADARGLVASGQLIRDVRLDRYLSAHKQFAGSSALGVPSGFLRNATADAADR